MNHREAIEMTLAPLFLIFGVDATKEAAEAFAEYLKDTGREQFNLAELFTWTAQYLMDQALIEAMQTANDVVGEDA
ncbi:hypothetical protein [Stutzerimonas stutzeri]|uniref:hypothetical protein n=1 Tax=Stutzerimonas stutzeri TaxID=316 RepID=UPI0002D64E30|nr:hypothetical protein [Stutzerimonas stutzeri]